MSYIKKRAREETSEQIHTHHKRLKDDHGVTHILFLQQTKYQNQFFFTTNQFQNSQRVNPLRFEQSTNSNATFSFGNKSVSIQHDPFKMPLPSDDEHSDEDKMQTHSRSPSNDANDTDFGLLLYELASLDVGAQKEQSEAPQTCPICSMRVSLKAFPDHVHSCLDSMDDSDLNDMRSQIEKDSDYATKYALNVCLSVCILFVFHPCAHYYKAWICDGL